MKRRDFLKTPGLGVVVPAALGIHAIPRGAVFGSPEGQETPGGTFAFPQNLHQDFVTYTSGIEYFLLGNGDIQAILQYAPVQNADKPQTFLGLTLMNPEHFARKWSSFLFHPEAGFGRTMVSVVVDGKSFGPDAGSFQSIDWKYVDNIPAVILRWKAGGIDVEEEFFVPEKGAALYRRVRATNNGSSGVPLMVNVALVPNFILFDDIHTEERSVHGRGFDRIRLVTDEKNVTTSFRYHISVDKGTLTPAGSAETQFTYLLGEYEPKLPVADVRKSTSTYWGSRTRIHTGNAALDHLFGVSQSGLKAGIARSGKRDSGIWMYNMEWVRDDSMVLLGLVKAGFTDDAKTILTNMLDRSVGSDGRTIESSRWFGHDYTELDQNGELLYAVWSYLCWTGDKEFVKTYWKKLALVADFPLQDVFWNKKARLLRNKREYWERSDPFGFLDGFELAYQFWVVLGLEKIADVAEYIGEKDPVKRWRAAAAEIKAAMLNDPVFRLIEDGHFIKRRTLEGKWQRYVVPPNRKSMPPASPLATEDQPSCEPDSSVVQPVVYGMVDASSDLARNTLAWVETLWNQRWTSGGYSRYNVSSEPDPPAPWPMSSLFLARAYAEAGNAEKVWRIVNWLHAVHGGKSGGFFERYGPSITPPAPPVGIVGWTWAEIVSLVCENIMGVRPDLDSFVLRPNMIDGIETMDGTFNIRGIDVRIRLQRTAGRPSASVNGRKVDVHNGSLSLKYPSHGSLNIEMNA